MRSLPIIVLIGLASGVGGCVLPPAFTIASFAADGLSLAFSRKTIADPRSRSSPTGIAGSGA